MKENAIAAQAAKKSVAKSAPTIKDYINAHLGEVAKALPSVMTPERFTRIATTAVTNNPKLASCNPQSFIGAMMQAAQLGLEPNTPLGQAYLIPYGSQCQFQLGYKGLIDLAYRSGLVSTIQAETVYENDTFEYQYGLEPKLTHIPATSDRGNPIYFYAVVKLKDGGYNFTVASVEDVRNHGKKYSKTFGNGPWKDNFEEMAKKTVLKRALKYAPLKSEFTLAVAQDETIKSEISDDMSMVENEFIEADAEIVDEEVIENAE